MFRPQSKQELGREEGLNTYRNPRTHTQDTDGLRFTPKHWDPERDTWARHMLTNWHTLHMDPLGALASLQHVPYPSGDSGYGGGQGRGCGQGRSQGGRQKVEWGARGLQNIPGMCPLLLPSTSEPLLAIRSLSSYWWDLEPLPCP